MNHDVQFIVFAKGEDRYVFCFTDETRADVLRTFGRFACNPELNFEWLDAAVLSQKVREMEVCKGK